MGRVEGIQVIESAKRGSVVFVTTRERLFLIDESTGNAYTRQHSGKNWEQVFGTELRELVLCCLNAANSNCRVKEDRAQ